MSRRRLGTISPRVGYHVDDGQTRRHDGGHRVRRCRSARDGRGASRVRASGRRRSRRQRVRDAPQLMAASLRTRLKVGDSSADLAGRSASACRSATARARRRPPCQLRAQPRDTTPLTNYGGRVRTRSISSSGPEDDGREWPRTRRRSPIPSLATPGVTAARPVGSGARPRSKITGNWEAAQRAATRQRRRVPPTGFEPVLPP